MKRASMGTSRNFLRENRMMVSQASPNYQMPTASSMARCCGPVRLLLAATQRGLNGGTGAKVVPSQRKLSEKQIQTEDISDERFLSAALLKCSEKTHTNLQSRSEGDDPVEGRGGQFLDERLHLRRTASNFELGKMPEQRDGYQPGQYTMHRPLANTFGILPGGLNYLDNCFSSSRKQDDEASICSQSLKASSPRVRQMDIPEMVDVNPDDILSLHSQESCAELPVVEVQRNEAEVQPAENSQTEDSQPILLNSEQRMMLMDAVRKRQNQLIAEYNRLPLSVGTLRVRNLKRQLEQQLDVLDYDLSRLSLANVYLKQESQFGTIAYQKLPTNINA
ncbi:uncharacterized protein LOC6737952 [Drosophila simulans]|uniref:GD12663 n=1 Tax=Drosophila simulans TaxID=7240 RepID=B4QJ25_DROSI|nr:uncharacterized protein LOC6737952 [Drosophila simulans]EDX10356.1 GD12663 [Drosophila simulans]KMY99392.1 uncharacterized protein Dsimw501_GD12663 [Drosophila simulans]